MGMKFNNGKIELSSHDLVGHLSCHYLTELDRSVAEGKLKRPSSYNPMLEVLRERGLRHEKAFLEDLETKEFSISKITDVSISQQSISETIEKMKSGDDYIYQATLKNGFWVGKADFLEKVEKPSKLGNFSYEVIDTKLSTETKGATILQLCLYSELVAKIQGVEPEFFHVVKPADINTYESFRYADFSAFFRKSKYSLETEMANALSNCHYPEPTSHCEICNWNNECDKRRRSDDHLSFVAGITKSQIKELKKNNINTLENFAKIDSPLPFKPENGSIASLERALKQAKIQHEARVQANDLLEVLEIKSGYGLTLLPAPSNGDIFLDIEGDPYVGNSGIEFLFGYCFSDDKTEKYSQNWALNSVEEKAIFENFIDFVSERRKLYPDLHIYHYAPYETSAIKRLMGKYASRQDEVDRLLRGKVFVDLYSITRNSILASVESYSIKQLEKFYKYKRQIPLSDANKALTKVTTALELDAIDTLEISAKDAVAIYNSDDCYSALHLRNWLEEIRTCAIEDGASIERPELGNEEPSSELSERQLHINKLIETLTLNVPLEEAERTNSEHAKWLLAYLLDWHRREDKAIWWEYFRLKSLSVDELYDEKSAISGLKYLKTIDETKRGVKTQIYSFPNQDADIKSNSKLQALGGEKLGQVVEFTLGDNQVTIKKSIQTADIHPVAVFAHDLVTADEQANSILRIAECSVSLGIENNGKYLAGLDLLMRKKPELNGQPFQNPGETSLESAIRISNSFVSGVLPIQGPPGTGKSYTAARMILEFVKQGKKVGITANSHKVILNLIEKVIDAAKEKGTRVKCMHKDSKQAELDRLEGVDFETDNAKFLNNIHCKSHNVFGATPFFWAREDAYNSVDVLFVDEAGQIALANALAVSHVSPRLVLLGDPQQLDQPTQGTHPDGTGVSVLEHLLNGNQTIEPDAGLFLKETWRLHPDICTFNSELFYESKLLAKDDCKLQTVTGSGKFTGSGIAYVPISHEGNSNSSKEEANAVKCIIDDILSGNHYWTNRSSETKQITEADILIITPYNSHVSELKRILPNFKIGTVDKFQGQEAPIAIYTMATSSHYDAPRGMEFLYSSNRLNVAISRAKCLAILVASPKLFDAECKTPKQMKLINSFCRLGEMARHVTL